MTILCKPKLVLLCVIAHGALDCYHALGQDMLQEDYVINPPNQCYCEEFGWAVSIYDDTAVVGDYAAYELGPQCGGAWIYRYLPSSGWELEKTLLPPEGEAYGRYGYAVAAGRNLAAIGALNYNETGLVFLYNYSKQNGWTAGEVLTGSDTQSADMFGSSLDLSGTTLVVGAPGHDGNASSSGAAYVFEWTEGAGWNETAKLEPSDLLTNSLFGTSVAVSCEAVAVGSDQHHGLDERQGCVYVFGRDADGKWIQQDKLYAPNGRIGDYFGDSISLDGKQLLVGAPYTRDDPEPGFAYMWLPSHSDGWELLQMLSASGVSSGDKFGADVAVHDSTAVVGAPYDDENGQLAGAAYLFYLEDGGWGERAKLLPFDAMSGDWTGARISIHRGTAITNANRHNGEKGAVFAFHDLAPLSLDIEGDCPGKMRITIYGAKPDDRLALLYGTKQGKTEALPYCPDLFVNIANPIVAAVGRADGMGQLTVTGKVPGKACGRLIVQGVDLTTCEKTKATLLE